MDSRYTKQGVIWRLLLFGAFIVGSCCAIVFQTWEYAVIALLGVVITAWNLLYFINGIHRKLDFFFEAVRNEDGSLHFPENIDHKSLKGVHRNMNRINDLVNEIKARQARSEQFFLEFMKRSASGMIAVDEEGFVEVVNDMALKIIGLDNLTHINRLEQQLPALYELMTHLQSGQGESLKIPEGRELKHLAIKVAVIRFSEKEYRIYSINDIKTEMETNELETWQKLIRIMTHEIMNSIAPVTSISQTLGRFFLKDGQTVRVEELGQQDVENTAQGLAVIGERAEGLLQFVDRYRKLTRLPQPEFKPIVLEQWLDSIKLLFEEQRKAHQIDLKIINDYPNTQFPGDESLLTHVVLNLLNNAVEAMEEMEARSIVIKTEATSCGGLRLIVTDSGRGFREEERDKIFLPFYTTRKNGSGIGLSLSRQIVHMHKGSISASSKAGEGAEFVLEL